MAGAAGGAGLAGAAWTHVVEPRSVLQRAPGGTRIKSLSGWNLERMCWTRRLGFLGLHEREGWDGKPACLVLFTFHFWVNC